MTEWWVQCRRNWVLWFSIEVWVMEDAMSKELDGWVLWFSIEAWVTR